MRDIIRVQNHSVKKAPSKSEPQPSVSPIVPRFGERKVFTFFSVRHLVIFFLKTVPPHHANEKRPHVEHARSD